MNDSLLSKMLAYRESLVDKEFVESILKRIERFQKLRLIIIAIACLVGTLGLSTIKSTSMSSNEIVNTKYQESAEVLSKLSELQSLPIESLSTLAILSMFFVAAWLIVAD